MKFISYIIVAVLGFGAAFFISNNAHSSKAEYDFSNVQNVTEETPESTSFSTYYEQLTDYQKDIYNTLLKPISTAESRVVLNNVNINDFNKHAFTAMVAIQYDHPEYFWYRGGYSATSTHVTFEETGEIVLEPLYYEYVSSMFNSAGKLNQLGEAVEKVATLARNHSSVPYEQMLFVHDYLIENAYYDHDALEEFYSTSHNPSCEYIFSAYGCLVEGKTVCSGYAKAFQLVMQKLGYDCSYVTGDAGEAHGWNCIYLDGEGYYVDITWDDMDLEKEVPLYDYAFITDEALNRTHTIDMEFDPPVCDATKYNYFRNKNYFLETYDFDAAAAILSKQSDADGAYIQFGSREELGRAYKDLSYSDRYKKIAGLGEFQKIIYNEQQHTLTILRKFK